MKLGFRVTWALGVGPLGIETGWDDTIKRKWGLGPMGPWGPSGSRQVGVIRTSGTGNRVPLGPWGPWGSRQVGVIGSREKGDYGPGA